jgi:anti-sigma factor RsiW
MSIDPEVLELIHADIDGIGTEHDRNRLRAAIAGDEAVRDEYRRLRGLGDVLARVQREEPPSRIAPAVMTAVRERRGRAGKGLVARLRAHWPGGGVALRYAYAVAAGAVLGMLGLHLATSGGLFGSPVAERDAAAMIAPSIVLRQLDLAPVGVQGFATARPSALGTAIGVELKSATPVELVVRYDPARDGDRVDVSVVRDGETAPAGSMRLPRRN